MANAGVEKMVDPTAMSLRATALLLALASGWSSTSAVAGNSTLIVKVVVCRQGASRN